MTTPTSDELHDRLQASYPRYHQASDHSTQLALAGVKALCAEQYPDATTVRCDITDQGGDTLVFVALEDAHGEDIDAADEDDTFRDRIEEFLGSITDSDVENAGRRRNPVPIIRLTDEFPVPPEPLVQQTVDATGKVTIHLDIPPEMWEPNNGIEHPNNHRHFAGTLVINGQLTHLEAIQVEQVGGIQTPNAAEYTDEIEALGTLSGDGPFETSTTIDDGHEFVVFAYPYC